MQASMTYGFYNPSVLPNKYGSTAKFEAASKLAFICAAAFASIHGVNSGQTPASSPVTISLDSESFSALTQPRFVSKAVDNIRRELMEYDALQDGWDGPDSVRPLRSNLAEASAWLGRLPLGAQLPRSMLSSNGDVGLYWDLNGGYAELTFEHEGELTFFATNRSGYREIIEGRALLEEKEKYLFSVVSQLNSDRLLII